MNRWRRRSAAFCALPLLTTASLAAAPPPKELVKTRDAFAAAVAAKDVKAAEALTSFPLKNTVYSAPPTIARTGFPKLLKMYAQMADCLKTGPLEPDPRGAKTWAIDCNGNVFHFALKDGRWLHSEYENINE